MQHIRSDAVFFFQLSISREAYCAGLKVIKSKSNLIFNMYNAFIISCSFNHIFTCFLWAELPQNYVKMAKGMVKTTDKKQIALGLLYKSITKICEVNGA